jgi:hypothetical protein
LNLAVAVFACHDPDSLAFFVRNEKDEVSTAFLQDGKGNKSNTANVIWITWMNLLGVCLNMSVKLVFKV